tara:strand:+ start:18758 stop:20428 length:1671 start_codon:yes stop_codon:yes gene_type:complete
MFELTESNSENFAVNNFQASSSTEIAFPSMTIAGLSLFKKTDPESIKKLLINYQNDTARIKNVYEVLRSPDANFALHYLQSGPNNYVNSSVSNFDSAIKGLSADYWSKALALTDVLDHMTADTRLECKNNIAGWDVPLFEQDAVVSTIIELLLNRDKYLAEKVDGIFKGLSKVHVTNDPAGFTKRFIMEDILGSCAKKEAIDNLRQVMASFMGRQITPMCHMNTGSIIEQAWKNNSGKWLEMDGGIIKFKVFKKQTIHFEIHPDLAWRLNEILSILYPHAIPEEFKSRKASFKKEKEFDLTQKLLSNDLLSVLVRLEPTRIWDRSGYEPRVTGVKENSVSVRCHLDNNALDAQLDAFMRSCGGMRANTDSQTWEFDYDFISIRDDIVRIGKAPDHITHQYFPTQTKMSNEVIERLDIKPTDELLEPSAGQAGIAGGMKGLGKSVVCVEVSALNCLVLDAIGFDAVINEDFIKYAATAPKFDKIGMNPPFSLGRAKLHVETALTLLKKSGSKLVAIVPPSLKNQLSANGYQVQWSEMFYNQFENTNVTVCIVEITKL